MNNEGNLDASPRIQARPEAHARERSIEVNVPFIQRRLPKAKLVALIMNAEDLATAQAVGEALAKAVSGKRVLVVASSDLSHYPPGPVAERVDPTTLHALASMAPANPPPPLPAFDFDNASAQQVRDMATGLVAFDQGLQTYQRGLEEYSAAVSG